MKKTVIPLLIFLSVILPVALQAQWQSLNGPMGGYVRSILCTDDLYYAATGGGVLVSSDHGASWEFRNNGLTSCDTKCLEKNGDTIILATDENVFRTTDGGLNWEADSYLHNHYVKHIEIYNGILYAATYVQGVYQSTQWSQGAYNSEFFPADVRYPYFIDSNGNTIFIATYGHGIYRSTDDGASWENCNNGLGSNDIMAVYCHDGRVFAAVLGFSTYVSDDNGNTWSRCNLNAQVKGFAHSGNTLYAASFGDGVYASYDNGDTWTNISWSLPATDLWCIATDGEYLFVGDSSGHIYRGTTAGTGWTCVSSQTFYASVGNIGISDGRVFAATHGCNLFYTDNGFSWVQKNVGTVEIRGMMVEGNNVFIGTDMLGSFLSTNHGESFSSAGNGLPEAKWLQRIVRCGDLVAAGSKDRMYIAYGLGETWHVPTCLPLEIDVVDIDWDGEIIYLVSYDGVARYSLELGSNWQVLSTPFTEVNYTALRCHDGALYLGTRGHGLHYTDSMGESWRKIEALPTDATIRRIATSDTIVAVGCEDGSIYLKYDHSEWQQMEDIPAKGPILDLCLNDGRIYASPMAGGVWYSELPAAPDAVAINEEALLTISPNPSTNMVKVSGKELKQIEVFNMQGQCVDSYQVEGQEARIDLGDLPAGIYLFNVVGEDGSRFIRKVLKK